MVADSVWVQWLHCLVTGVSAIVYASKCMCLCGRSPPVWSRLYDSIRGSVVQVFRLSSPRWPQTPLEPYGNIGKSTSRFPTLILEPFVVSTAQLRMWAPSCICQCVCVCMCGVCLCNSKRINRSVVQAFSLLSSCWPQTRKNPPLSMLDPQATCSLIKKPRGKKSASHVAFFTVHRVLQQRAGCLVALGCLIWVNCCGWLMWVGRWVGCLFAINRLLWAGCCVVWLAAVGRC